MPVNVGTVDQYVRIMVGLALVAFASRIASPFKGGIGPDWPGLSCL
jgi:hypothetical protein